MSNLSWLRSFGAAALCIPFLLAACSDDDAAAPVSDADASAPATIASQAPAEIPSAPAPAIDAGTDASLVETTKLGNGEACAAKEQCGSGFCVDGVCCGDVCTGECQSCNVAGSKGTCSNIPRLEPDLSYFDPVFQVPDVICKDVGRCDGQGKCRRLIAKGCAADDDCLSNSCFDTGEKRVCKGAIGETCNNGFQCASNTCNADGACT